MASSNPQEPFRIVPRFHRGGCIAVLSGIVDQSFNRREVLDQLAGASPIVFDCDGVTRITSYGVREWVAMLKGLTVDYYFIHCHSALMTQFNLIEEFGGTGQLVSFYAPYVCEEFGHDSEFLIDLRSDSDLIERMEPATKQCPFCATRCEFDDVPEVYFSYVRRARPRPIPALAEVLIDGLFDQATSSSPAGAPLRIQKQVTDTLTAITLTGSIDQTARLKRLGEGLDGLVLVDLGLVDTVSGEGLERFESFLNAADGTVYLNRAPLNLSSNARCRVLSVRVPHACASCGWFGNLLMRPPFEASGAEGSAHGCPRCLSSRLWPKVSSAELHQLRALPAVDIPIEIEDYLARGPNQPPEMEGVQFGSYKVIRRLGHGGMAEVFLARKTGPEGFHKQVVLKCILEDLSDSPNHVEMFFREATLAARLSHPNIVQIFDFGKISGRHFIAMEYVRGWDLSVLHKLCKRLDLMIPYEIVCRVMSNVCSALSAAHGATEEGTYEPQPIIHRDVSPHNILISTDGIAKLADFGIAKAADSVDLTDTGEVHGKLAYMAPERLDSSVGHTVDHRIDIFSTGVALFESLTLRRLFRRADRSLTIRAIKQLDVPRLDSLRPDAPPQIGVIIAKALARNPSDRYDSAEEMQLDLEEAITRCGHAVTSSHVAAWFKAVVAKGIEQDLARDLSIDSSTYITEAVRRSTSGRAK